MSAEVLFDTKFWHRFVMKQDGYNPRTGVLPITAGSNGDTRRYSFRFGPTEDGHFYFRTNEENEAISASRSDDTRIFLRLDGGGNVSGLEFIAAEITVGSGQYFVLYKPHPLEPNLAVIALIQYRNSRPEFEDIPVEKDGSSLKVLTRKGYPPTVNYVDVIASLFTGSNSRNPCTLLPV
jgi:hypothetical protein